MNKIKIPLNLFILLICLLFFSCGQPEQASRTDQQNPVQKKRISKEERMLKREKRKEESKKLYDIAISGKDENIVYVRLTRENKFTDKLSENLYFTRAATSGPGTGKFTGSGFEFAEGKCEDTANISNDGRKRIRWRKRINKCQYSIIKSDWCARLKDNPSEESYTLTFFSWPIGDGRECAGACEEHDFKTSYIRVRNR